MLIKKEDQMATAGYPKTVQARSTQDHQVKFSQEDQELSVYNSSMALATPSEPQESQLELSAL